MGPSATKQRQRKSLRVCFASAYQAGNYTLLHWSCAQEVCISQKRPMSCSNLGQQRRTTLASASTFSGLGHFASALVRFCVARLRADPLVRDDAGRTRVALWSSFL